LKSQPNYGQEPKSLPPDAYTGLKVCQTAVEAGDLPQNSTPQAKQLDLMGRFMAGKWEQKAEGREGESCAQFPQISGYVPENSPQLAHTTSS